MGQMMTLRCEWLCFFCVCFRAYVHQYAKFGIMEEDFLDSFTSLEQIISSYSQLGWDCWGNVASSSSSGWTNSWTLARTLGCRGRFYRMRRLTLVWWMGLSSTVCPFWKKTATWKNQPTVSNKLGKPHQFPTWTHVKPHSEHFPSDWLQCSSSFAQWKINKWQMF